MTRTSNRQIESIQHQARDAKRRTGARGPSRTAPAVAAVALAAVAVAGCSSTSSKPSAAAGSSAGASSSPSSAAPSTGSQIVPAGVSGKTTVQAQPKRVPDTSGIKGVLAWDTQGGSGALQHDHVLGPVKYLITPPVGGPHNGIWMNAGVYTKPVPSERAVHDLEHGAVWITYRPDLPDSKVKQLVALVGRQSMIPEGDDANRYVDLSPWQNTKLPSPIVISSWGHQLRVTSPTDPRLQKFIDTFRHSQKYTPEYGAPVDGIPVQTGGRPSTDGSKNPNPPGAVAGQGM